MSMDGNQVCKEIANLHDNIVSAEIVEKGVTIAAHIKKSGTLPKLERLFAQTELYIHFYRQMQSIWADTLFDDT